MSILHDTTIQVHPANNQEMFYHIHVEHTEFDPTKRTLALIHGYLGTNDDFFPLMNKYKKDYNILALDLRGHGESDSPTEISWRIEDFTFEVYQVISSFIPTNHKVDIVASSLATAIALQFTKDYPDLVNSLILISPTNKFSRNFLKQFLINVGKIAPDFVMNTLVDVFNVVMPLFVFNEKERELVVDGFNRIKNIDIATHRKIFEETTLNYHIDVYDIRKKTLIIAGLNDTTVPYSDSYELNNQLPISTMVTIPKMKHLILLKKMDLIMNLLDLWLTNDYKLLRFKHHDEDELENLFLK
ncbi:MAG: alpha/beta hydrolase [Candidatus Heimdallarchaeota archaeon]|nr:alpha/beta hydrolase [Candidatus Heimdallarchaeota archaeon]